MPPNEAEILEARAVDLLTRRCTELTVVVQRQLREIEILKDRMRPPCPHMPGAPRSEVEANKWADFWYGVAMKSLAEADRLQGKLAERGCTGLCENYARRKELEAQLRNERLRAQDDAAPPGV